MRAAIIFCLSCLLFSQPLSASNLYKWVDKNGVTHFSDEAPDSGAKRVYPSGMSVIPMRENIRVDRNVRNINRAPSSQPSAPTQTQSNSSRSYAEIQEERDKQREEERQRRQCEQYAERLDWLDSRLRAGNYSNSQGNRWRSERRDLSSKRAWKCLRD